VLVLLRELISGPGHAAGAGLEYRDREIDAAEITLGCAPDCTLQILGADVQRQHARLKTDGDGFSLSCVRGATVMLDGKAVRHGRLAPGSELGLGGARLRVTVAPPGFDGALEFTPASDVPASAFEAAYLTDLEQTRLSRRRPAWLLAIALIAIGLIIPWTLHRDALPWWASDQIWSTGPLLPAHEVAIGSDCSACHQVPFQRVQDQTCTTCHRDMTDHAVEPLNSHVGLADIRCATCHKEHNTPVHITITADALCTDCHAAPDWPENRLASAQGFTLATHPPFNVDLLVSTQAPRGTGLAYSWAWQSSPLADAEDRSNLKFPHDLHLDANKVQDMTSGDALSCGSCHRLQADQEHFAPIRMERHCRDCHDLKFDRNAPDRELPHANPAEALLTMEGHYMRLYADPDVGQPTRERRRLPDRGAAADTCTGPAYLCARARTAREAETQFTVRGCVTCHEVTVHETTDLLGRYQVAPVRLTPDFYTNARFNHRAHLTQRDATGDAACLTCHAADVSSASADVLMPDIDHCVTCHGDHRQRGLIQLNCVDCHSFHPGVLMEGAE